MAFEAETGLARAARFDPPGGHAEGNSTEHRILRGAIDALGRHGSHSLSMSDIALAAKVSRATLYRYFRTKAAVLEAVSEFIATDFVRGAEQIDRTVQEPTERLKAIMSLQLRLATEEFITRITEVEPGLVLRFLSDHFGPQAEAMRRVLDPLFDQLEEASGLELDRDMLAAAVLRMQLSLVIVPPDERWRASPGVLAELLKSAMRGSGKTRRKSGSRHSNRTFEEQ